MTSTLRAPVLVPGLATGIGSLPHTDARDAAEVVLRCLPEFPAAPQLPARDPREGMLAQWLGALPEVEVGTDGSFAILGNVRSRARVRLRRVARTQGCWRSSTPRARSSEHRFA